MECMKKARGIVTISRAFYEFIEVDAVYPTGDKAPARLRVSVADAPISLGGLEDPVTAAISV